MFKSIPTSEALNDTRARIVAAAARLVLEGGSNAATTRAVAEAAGVQAPTIYRLFGDKDGLLEAVAEHTLADFVAGKASRAGTLDPVDDLIQGWDDYIAFGLANPAVFMLMAAPTGGISSANAAGLVVLRERVKRLAATGRLGVSEEQAVDLIHAVGTGTVFVLLEKGRPKDSDLSSVARDTILSAILLDKPAVSDQGAAGAASALRSKLSETLDLSPAERELLSEWLERISRRS